MARRKDSPQKAAMREMMRDYLKNNDISIKDGTDVNSIMRDMMSVIIIIGYAATKTEGLQILADYNRNPYDTKAAKMTFDEVYEEWSKKKFPTVSESNIEGYKASYKTCGILYNRIFKDLKLADLRLLWLLRFSENFLPAPWM